MSFVLHPRLEADGTIIADWTLSRVLLKNDRRFLWLILVPRRDAVSEIFDLDEADRTQLWLEVARAAQHLKDFAQARGVCDKINIGAIGNIVLQLHVHVVARALSDPAWPDAVWGFGEPEPYSAVELAELRNALRDGL